jgi:hypothetical protein
LEEQQVEFFGLRLPEEQTKREIAAATNFWLSPVYLQKMVSLYLQNMCGQDQEYILGEKPLKTLRMSQDARNCLLKDFQRLSTQNTPIYREWENWLKGSDPHLKITFDSDCAMQHSEASFISPLHPLVKQAAMFFNSGQKIVTKLRVTSEAIPAGRYEFAIYQWRFMGIREDLLLKPVMSDNAVAEQLAGLLEHAVDHSVDIHGEKVDAMIWEGLDKWHYDLWKNAKAEHCQKNQELTAYRKESLTTSHKARIALLQEQFDQAKNEKIKKMRQSQINSAESDYHRRIQELDIAVERADIIADPVAYGVLIVEEE